VNNILEFRGGGIKIVQRRKKVVFEGSKSRGEMNKKTFLEEGKKRISTRKRIPTLHFY